MIKFKIGENVKWISYYNGVNITRKGKILFIIDPFTTINELYDENRINELIGKNFNIINNNDNKFFTEYSYLIIVGERDGKIPDIHWPNPKLLSKIIIKKRKIKKNNKY